MSKDIETLRRMGVIPRELATYVGCSESSAHRWLYQDGKPRKKFQAKLKEMASIVSESLVHQLKRLDLPQETLSGLLGVSRPTVSRWLSGHRKPDAESLNRIEEVLTMPAAELESRIAEIERAVAKPAKPVAKTDEPTGKLVVTVQGAECTVTGRLSDLRDFLIRVCQ